MSRITVLIADDHAIVRDGLALVINGEPDMRVVALASDGEQAVAAASQHKPHVAVLDMRMPRLGGVAAIRALRERCPDTKVLVLSMYDDERLASAAVAAGAHGYLGKQAPSSTLLRAIRAVHAGAKLSEAPASDTERSADAEGAAPLSLREREVMQRIIAGHTSRAIADQLGITKSSVDTYRARIFQKLGVSDRAELVARVTNRGDVEP
jgi:DNA-binding NarL/FixJ family response regulator